MRILLGALVALLGLQSTHAMSCSATVNGVNYDLSSLQSEVKYVVPDVGNYNYYINPCGAVQQASCSTKGSAFVCQVRKSPVDQFEAVVGYSDDAHTPAPIWSASQVNPSAGVLISFTNGDTCNLRTRTALVDFNCDNTGTGKVTVNESPQCTFNVNYPTPAVCPGYVPPNGGGGGGGGGSGSGESKGLSGGWIFIIILLVGSFVLLVAGTLYKRQKLGAQGLESVPLIDFWRELPGLVKDGCRFTYAKISSLCGGKSGSTEPYETIK